MLRQRFDEADHAQGPSNPTPSASAVGGQAARPTTRPQPLVEEGKGPQGSDDVGLVSVSRPRDGRGQGAQGEARAKSKGCGRELGADAPASLDGKDFHNLGSEDGQVLVEEPEIQETPSRCGVGTFRHSGPSLSTRCCVSARAWFPNSSPQ